MKVVILIALMLAVGQVSASPAEQLISVQHDSVRGVTCWLLNNTGISCLPDSSLPQQATPTREAGRASQASAAHESKPLPATPLPQHQGFKL